MIVPCSRSKMEGEMYLEEFRKWKRTSTLKSCEIIVTKAQTGETARGKSEGAKAGARQGVSQAKTRVIFFTV